MGLSVPAQIVEIIGLDERRARVDVAGVVSEMSIALLHGEGAGGLVGDWVLVHNGHAIAGIGADEARERLAAFRHIFREARGSEWAPPG